MLEVSHLNGIRGEKELFSDLTFSAESGQWVWVRGPNGSGKSTLLKTLVGLLPSVGKISWKGYSIPRFHPSFFRELVYLSHIPALHPALTPEENLEWYASLYEIDNARLVITHALDSLGIVKERKIPCEQLSFGQCQRVALARLYLQQGNLWVLDEPCTGLDEKGQDLFEEWLNEHLDKRGIAVIASHDLFQEIPKPTQTIELKILEQYL